MKTAGVMFDFYDDPTGSVLKSVFPDAEELPEVVKTAHILNAEERDVLRDEAYALVMHNDGQVFRKFACVDPGNTLLSLVYFEKTAGILPQEARDAAYANIMARAAEFDLLDKEAESSTQKTLNETHGLGAMAGAGALYAHLHGRHLGRGAAFGGTAWLAAKGLKAAVKDKKASLEKSAVKKEDEEEAPKKDEPRGTGKHPQRKRDPMEQPFAGDEADWAQRTNLRSIQAGGPSSGRVGEALSNLNTKTAAAPGVMQQIAAHGKKAVDWAKPHAAKAVEAVKANPGLAAGAAGAGIVAGRMSKNASVDVSGQTPEIRFVKQAAEHHALGHKFPLDSYSDIRAAVDYFKQSWPDFQPPERHEFAVKVAARAEAIGLEVPELMARYGSTSYAPDVEAHLANRKANCGAEFHEVYDALKEKRAEIEPEHFAALLSKADVTTGLNWHWGGAVSDPWLATFGGTTASEKTAFGWEGGGYTVDAEKLQEAAASGVLKGNFTDDIVTAFEKDPVTIFSSMPDDTKLIMARLASEA
jgi:hypothetical protein